tara:strand:- start:436 stop:1167 length:732 start_codon:yes stop_codon:yes gene_type:complete
MINLFKKVRKNLLSENKFSRYLIYAIGEIVLVVVGILIALQINIWNENRKLEILELSLLKEMKSNLMSDISDIKENIFFTENGINSANIILKSFENNIPYNDSLNKHFGKVPMVPKFLMTENAYNSMNNEGIRIIKNDSLRKAITNHYEKKASWVKAWNDAEWDTQIHDHQNMYRKLFKKFNFWGDLKPVDYENLSENQEYLNYLNNRIGWLNPTKLLYERAIRLSERLINLIDIELDKREAN